MSEKWTPEPWFHEGTTIYALDETGVVNRFSAQISGGYTVHYRHSQSSLRTTAVELVANAHLIAAAPDLAGHIDGSIVDLNLLRRAINEGDPKPELLIRVDDMLRRASAALSRARGE